LEAGQKVHTEISDVKRKFEKFFPRLDVRPHQAYFQSNVSGQAERTPSARSQAS
jgi:hypothetical protein